MQIDGNEEPPLAGNCDPCYPDVCMPPPPPDLDYGEIPVRRSSVPVCDSRRFDGDKDGLDAKAKRQRFLGCGRCADEAFFGPAGLGWAEKRSGAPRPKSGL